MPKMTLYTWTKITFLFWLYGKYNEIRADMSLSPKMFAQNQYAANNFKKKDAGEEKSACLTMMAEIKIIKLKHNPTKY